MEWINESTIGIGLGILSSFAGGFKLLNVIRKRNVAIATYHTYHIVNDLAMANPAETKLDKTAEAFRLVDQWMASNGWRPLGPQEQALAYLVWKSMHGKGL